jgi:hypothetical protein
MTEILSEEEFGKQGQDLVINYLEKDRGCKFLAGERDGTVYNIFYIEETEKCFFIPECRDDDEEWHGNQLLFANEEKGIIMPDFLMSRPNDTGDYWVEAKRHHYYSDKLYIVEKSFLDYQKFYEDHTDRDMFVMLINPYNETHINIYYCPISKLIESPCIRSLYKKKYSLLWSIKKTMKKLNESPLLITDYLF